VNLVNEKSGVKGWKKPGAVTGGQSLKKKLIKSPRALVRRSKTIICLGKKNKTKHP